MITSRYPFAATTYKPQLVEHVREIMLRTTLRNTRWNFQYEPQFVLLTQDYHIIGHNLWLLNQVETLHTSHNSHTHTSNTHHSESQLKECPVFILYPEPQLKGCHSEPQIKECHVFTLHPETQRVTIMSHNSRNVPTKSILKVSPKAW